MIQNKIVKQSMIIQYQLYHQPLGGQSLLLFKSIVYKQRGKKTNHNDTKQINETNHDDTVQYHQLLDLPGLIGQSLLLTLPKTKENTKQNVMIQTKQ